MQGSHHRASSINLVLLYLFWCAALCATHQNKYNQVSKIINNPDSSTARHRCNPSRMKRSNRSRRWKWIRRLVFALVSCWAVLTLWQAPVVKRAVTTNELQGVWLTNYGAALSYYSTRLDEADGEYGSASPEYRLSRPSGTVGIRCIRVKLPVKQGGLSAIASRPFHCFPFKTRLAKWFIKGIANRLRVIPWFEYGLLIPRDSAIRSGAPRLAYCQAGWQ